MHHSKLLIKDGDHYQVIFAVSWWERNFRILKGCREWKIFVDQAREGSHDSNAKIILKIISI